MKEMSSERRGGGRGGDFRISKTAADVDIAYNDIKLKSFLARFFYFFLS